MRIRVVATIAGSEHASSNGSDQAAGWFGQGVSRRGQPARGGRGDRQAAGRRGGRGDGRGAGRRPRSPARERPRSADRAADPDPEGPRGARRPAAFDRAHHGPGHHAAVPGRAAGVRPDHRQRLLLRRRRPRPQPLRGRLPGHRGRDGPNHQGRRAVRAVHPARRPRPASSSPTWARRSRSSTSTTSCTSTAC